jgi:glycosyltransferase involved in cell wall biosynthesis
MRKQEVVVATCIYNGGLFLREQLESITGQSRSPDRMIIVDDASSDGSLEIARDFARDAPFPVDVAVNAKNVGYVKNFERAIRLARGDLIVLCDQDDVWDPSKLLTIQRAFEQSPNVGLVFSDAEVVDSALHPLGYRLWHAAGFSPQRQALARRGEAFELLLRGNFVTGATMAFRGCFRDLVLPIPGGVLHDGWIALLIAAVAEVSILPAPLIQYRQHGKNQIGIREWGVADRLARGRRLTPNYLGDLRRQHVEARERLEERDAAVPECRRMLQDAIDHLDVRLGLPRHRVARLPQVASEVMRGRYQQRSNGLRSALRDLLV